MILTGGDPLLLSSRRLGAILAALDAIPHVQTLRIHSRVPVADPAMLRSVTPALETQTPLWLVVHANHARELTAEPCGRPAPRSAAWACRCWGSPCCCAG